MFVLNARPHSETGVSPYVLKFGTADGTLFQPDQHERYEGLNQYIQHLDNTLATVRQVAQDALDKLTDTRQAPNPPISTQYQPGDFLLFSIPKMSRTSKLSTPWSGPYEVITQRNNDIETCISMTEDRNLSVHTYSEEMANDLYAKLPEYARVSKLIAMKIKEKAKI